MSILSNNHSLLYYKSYNPMISNFKAVLTVSALLAIVTSLFITQIWIGILLVLIIFLTMVYKEKFVIFISIVTIFTLVGEVNPALRLFVQFATFGALCYMFIKKYGLEFSSYPKVPTTLLKFFLFFYFAIALSLIFSNYKSIGLQFTFRLTIFFIIAYLFYALIDSNKWVKLYLYSLAAAAVTVAIGSFYKLFVFMVHDMSFIIFFQLRHGSFISNVNAIAAFFSIMICIVSVFLFSDLRKINKYSIIILIFIFFLGILISNSRGALLGTLVGFTVIFYYLNKKLLKIFFIGSILSLILIFSIHPLQELFSELIRIDTGLSRRNYLWDISFSMLKDHFLVGVGPGGWGQEMFNYFPVLLDTWIGKTFTELYSLTSGKNNSHNFYLAMFTDLGVLGLIASILLPYIFIRMGIKTIRLAKSVNYKVYLLIIGITAAGSGMFVRAFFEGISIITYGWMSVDLPFWMIFGILSYYYLKFSKDENRVTKQSVSKI